MIGSDVRQSYGSQPCPWGRATKHPKFIDVGGCRIQCIATGQQFTQEPYGKWVPVSHKDAAKNEAA